MKITATHSIIGNFRHAYVAAESDDGEKAIYRLPFYNKKLKRNYILKKCLVHKYHDTYSFALKTGKTVHVKRSEIEFKEIDHYLLADIKDKELPF